VLNHLSGKLAGSVHADPTVYDGEFLRAYVYAAGGPAWYGKVHEYGGQSAYVILPVTKKALRFLVGGKEVFAKSVLHPPLPQRAFMSPSLEENQDEMVQSLQETINEVIGA
jgi:hypothetical protein